MPKTRITEVIDGDTIKGLRNKFIRLAGVDAPEMGTRGGAVAKKELKDMVLGKTISYTEDAMSYGRIVGEVKLGGKSVNKEMKRIVKKI